LSRASVRALPGSDPQKGRTVDEHTISPAGDPFYAARRHDEPVPCLCDDGWHYIGHVVELPDGDEDIEYDRVPCRRCNSGRFSWQGS
jgi:hypothetical protein